MKKILLIGLTALLFLSCENSNIDINQNYIGVWNNTSGDLTRTLEVKSNGKCSYQESVRTGNKIIYSGFEGYFVLEGSTLTIGLKTLTINKEPAVTNSIWHLTMNNNEYTRE